ncbi:MAG: hypothetical protein Q9169_003749 [Polycauliona sp. 2 TL-2023]
MVKWRYGVVLDAGSSGTRLHIYKWVDPSNMRKAAGTDNLHSLPELKTEKKWTKKIHPGVSTFGETPDRIGPDHLKKFFDHALEIVPRDAVSDTPFLLLATAGMRLLPDSQRSKLLAEMCSYARSQTDFLIPDCGSNFQVISGSTEGLYGWVAANYLLGGFDAPNDHDHGKDHHTYGFLDMGGASAQIAFAPNTTEAERHANDLTLLRLRTLDGNPVEYRVFVTTWLEYGVNEARRRYVEALLKESGQSDPGELRDPCLPKGLETTIKGDILLPGSNDVAGKTPSLLGTGNFQECLKKTYPLLDKDAPCEDEPCLLHGIHVPAIDFDVNHFVGVSEYWHTTHEVFEMAHKDKAYDFQTYQERVEDFCKTDWKSLQEGIKKHEWGKKVDEGKAIEVCFKSSWLISILHDGIGIPRVGIEKSPGSSHNGTKEVLESAKDKGFTDSFQAVDKIADTEVSWTLGKMVIYASSQVRAKDDGLPVGFGRNVPGLPDNFEYGALIQATPSKGWHDTLFDGDTPRRLPGFILFVLIICVAGFLLCGRERRQRVYNKLGVGSSRRPGSPKRRGVFGGKVPFFRSSTSHGAYERVLEEGVQADEFELGPIDGDEENCQSDSSTGSGYRPPHIHDAGSHDLYEHSNSSQGVGLGIMGRSGLTGRIDSKDRLVGMSGPALQRSVAIMPFLMNLRQSLGGYWTPDKQKTKRLAKSSTLQGPTPRTPSLAEGATRLDRDSTASPTKRTSEWITDLRGIPGAPGPLAVKGSRVIKGPTAKRQTAKTKAKFWHRVLPKFLAQHEDSITQDDIEGSTLLDRGRPSLSPYVDDEDTQIGYGEISQIDQYPHIDEGEAGPSLITPGDDDRYYQPTKEDLEIMKSWTQGQVWLFHELNNRCFKPLIRETWRNYDFVTFPDDVVSNDDNKVPIKPLFGSEYNACRALRKLCFLGSRVRDKAVCGLRSEPTMRRELHDFYKWTIMDAGLSRIAITPLVTICTAFPNEHVDSVVGRVTDRLHELGRQYRHLFSAKDPETGDPIRDSETRSPIYTRELPTLYGIVIYKHIGTVVTYDSRYPKKGVQLMNTNNFTDGGEDVWHAFSMALVMVKARDDLLLMMKDGVSFLEIEEDSFDPDA